MSENSRAPRSEGGLIVLLAGLTAGFIAGWSFHWLVAQLFRVWP